QRLTNASSYFMVVGPDSVVRPGTVRKLADISDGTSQTILMAEVADSHVNWLDPRDLDSRSLSIVGPDGTHASISSNDPRGPGVVFADGKLLRVSPKFATPAFLRPLVTSDGGEPGDQIKSQITHREY